MRVEHYTYNVKVYGQKWRWRILDDEGEVVVQGLRQHDSIEESKGDVAEVTEFLDAMVAERSRQALGGWAP